MLVPVPLWFAFFTEYNYGGEYFAVIATTVYLLLKVRIDLDQLNEVLHIPACIEAWLENRNMISEIFQIPDKICW